MIQFNHLEPSNQHVLRRFQDGFRTIACYHVVNSTRRRRDAGIIKKNRFQPSTAMLPTAVTLPSVFPISYELLAPNHHLLEQGTQRTGHIPGSASIPLSMTMCHDGTFK